jgi:aminotransferase
MTNGSILCPRRNHSLRSKVLKSLRIGRRLKKIRPSGIRRLFSLAQGVPNVISLGIGEPDFIPPAHILEAAKRALDEGRTHYTPTAGIPELREALVEKAKRDYDLSYDPNSEVLVTAGGTEAIFLALLALINPGDEVLIPDPGFVCYEPGILMAGGGPVSMPVLEKKGFKPDAKVVMSLITDKSRVIITNTPNNPTGSVLSHNDITALAKLAIERDLIVISDEVYEKITYDDVEHHCLATFPGMRERTVVVNSFSKTYAMTGLRVGYALGPEELISAMTLAHQYITACVNGPAQYAALAALEGSQRFVRDMVSEFDRRRRLLHSRLNEIEGFSYSLPKGAFYAFVNIKEFGNSSEELSEHLLKNGKIVTVPGSAFGRYGEGYLRFSYATTYEKIEEALYRIGKIAGELR